MAGAAAFAAAELAVTFALGGFSIWGRAEALLFFAFRPWLLLIAVLLVIRFGWRRRLIFYALALFLAGTSESLVLLGLASHNPWPEMLRGWAAGALLLAVIDPVLHIGRRLYGSIGQSIAVAAIVLLLVLPQGMRYYNSVALGPTGARPAAERPDLLLMTGLPIIWGDAGPFDPESRPSLFYKKLQGEFDVRVIDYLGEESLSKGELMLLAQPRALAPEELVALDDWIRGGGRTLILADPRLVWPSPFPPGDIRRPPPVSLLSPLFSHWGFSLEAEPEARLAVEHLRQDGELRRMALGAPGRFRARGGGCRVASVDYFAACRIGAGRALLLADADLLRDEMWAAPTPRGGERHARMADNPLVIASWLDRLGGIERDRADRTVRWAVPGADMTSALLLALAPLLGALALAFAWGRFRRN